jgi:hypothetical protein
MEITLTSRRRTAFLAMYRICAPGGAFSSPNTAPASSVRAARATHYWIMEHKGIVYSVVQTASPRGWRWTVELPPPQRTRTGHTYSRSDAVLAAKAAIDKLDPQPTANI